MDALTGGPEAIVLRLERLETTSRRLNVIGIIGLSIGGFSLLLMMGVIAFISIATALAGGTIEGSEIILRDSLGRGRVWIAVKDGAPFLVLTDSTGKPRIRLDVEGEEPGMNFFDASRQTRVGLAIATTGPGIIFLDSKGKPLFKAP